METQNDAHRSNARIATMHTSNVVRQSTKSNIQNVDKWRKVAVQGATCYTEYRRETFKVHIVYSDETTDWVSPYNYLTVFWWVCLYQRNKKHPYFCVGTWIRENFIRKRETSKILTSQIWKRYYRPSHPGRKTPPHEKQLNLSIRKPVIFQLCKSSATVVLFL